MIEDLGWQSLQSRRNNPKLVVMYQITYGLVDIPVAGFLHPATPITRGRCLHYLAPYSRIDTYAYSFLPSGIRLWKSLPEVLVTAPSLDIFKEGLQR